MPNFRHVIRAAYLEILLRKADPGGLDAYNRLLNSGLTEAQLRESLLRSPEFATRFPEAPAGLDPSPFGVNSHIAGDDILESLASIGIRWHRVDVDWNVIERAEGEYDWRELDRVIATAGRLNLSVYATIAYTPGWASGTNDRASPPRDPAQYHGFVRRVARRYRGRVQCLGVWNEPDLPQFFRGTREQYLRDILVPGLQAIREEAPEVATGGPDLSGARNALRDWLRLVLDAAGSLLDVITHHQYGGNDTVAGRVREIESVRSFLVSAGHGETPFWLTETGWSVSPSQQADLLRGMLREMLARPWWNKTFWYDSHGPGTGLLESDSSPQPGAPKPAFFAYRDLIAESVPPRSAMTNFRHVITDAYMRILLRPPDAGGLESYNRAINSGLTEAQLRESLLRSAEYAIRFPEPPGAAAARGQAGRKSTRRRKTARGKAALRSKARK